MPAEALRPASEVEARDGLDDLPWRPDHFVGRNGELDRLDAALARPGVALVQAVHGLGGIGKSTLAAHWATTRDHGHQPVRWFTADSPAGIQQGLADLAVALQPALKVLPVEALAEYGLQWLATHTGWLVVLDNVNDPAHVTPLLVRAPGGRFLITSRLGDGWGANVSLVRLDVLDPDESLALLTSIITSASPRDLDGAAELCAELGHLPLAVEQAAAYIAQTPFSTPRTYLQLLAEHPAQMYGQAGALTDAERTVARVWNITLDHIATRQPAAVDLLRSLAWYAPDAIPARLATLDDHGPVQTNQALGLLTAYSMISPDPATGTITVHRLVQALARTPDPTDPHRTPELIDQARENAVTHLTQNLPTTPQDPLSWDTWRQLLPHIDALTHHTREDTDTPATAYIHNEAGLFLQHQGLLHQAISYLHRAQTHYEHVLGPEHSNTLTTRNNLANAYQDIGDHTQAISLHQQTLEIRTRILGPEHPHTLTTRNNLASTYQNAGDHTRAIPLLEQTLKVRTRILGPEHPQTLTSRNNLAHAYETAGDHTRAIPLLEQTLKDRTRILGPEHPDTLTTRNNLAGAYQTAGDHIRAISLLEQTVEAFARILGPEHPDTLTTRNNLASAYQTAGDHTRVIPLLEQTLKDRTRILGPEHPDTLASRNNLAHAYQTAGDHTRAIPLLEQTVEAFARILGPEHPYTLTTRSNLANAYQTAGDHTRVIPLLEQTLKDRTRILGPEHPDTLASRSNLASTYQIAGDHTRAIPLLEQTLKDRTRILGPEHPQTLASRNNLAHAYQIAGDHTRAIPLLEQTLKDRTRILGPEHPDTLTTRNNLAGAYQTAGDHTRAISLLEQTVEAFARILGPEHPDTLTTRNNLAHVHRLAGDLDQAITLLRRNMALCAGRSGIDHRLARGIQQAYTLAWQKRAVIGSKLEFRPTSRS
ncbi:FxSxx-COOH system tetratricopeptide repeat protein [Streptomyces sp. PanSC9]|uniref:FxSxx-COOH system tetratricopeptide repeat protein n=1 Tax=Streptomyces sp. PanSC9 TaxID=1520461 RepID=UPI0011CE88BE|nr:FxSxx-COOH system tetratricopeptide repeat protein [Streptomyces sp. PanSC9]